VDLRCACKERSQPCVWINAASDAAECVLNVGGAGCGIKRAQTLGCDLGD